MPFKRPGSRVWQIRVNGVRQSSGTTDYEAAKALEHKLNHQAWEERRFGAKRPRSFQELCVRWGRERSHKASWQDDLRIIEWWSQFLRDEPDIRKISRERVDDLILQHRPVRPSDRTPANATANRYVATLSAMLNAAHEEWAWIEYAPSLRRYPELEPSDVWLSVEEWRRLVVQLPAHLARTATFALATGLRESKVFGLTWQQVNLQGRWMGFKGTDNKLGNVIPLNQTAISVLTEAATLPVRSTTFVFLYKGKSTKCYGKSWYKALVRAGLGNWNEEREWRGFHWHGLRHTFATWLRHGGAPDWAVDALGGWSRSATRERYSHIAVEALRPHAAIIDTLLAQTNGQGSEQLFDSLVGRAGFEPATNGLKVRCSTN